jgi:hypothetical protein
MPNRPHPRNPSRTKLFTFLDRGLDLKAAAKKAGYRRSPQMLCHLRKIWTDHLYARQEADKAARAAEKTHQEATATGLAAARALAITRSQEEAEDRKKWLNGASQGHTITFEAWRSLGKPTPQNVPYRDPVTGSDRPSSPFPSPS